MSIQKFFRRRATLSFLFLGMLLGGCGRQSPPAAAPAPSASVSPGIATPTPAPALAGRVTPALVGQGTDSVGSYLRYPTSEPSTNSIVQFYCDISDNGIVQATYALVGKEAAFRTAVQSALDWGRFTPATVDGHPTPSYIGGTVIFAHKDDQPVVVITLTTYDRERIEKMANYIQPQMIGGLRRQIDRVMRQIAAGALPPGQAEVIVKVDARGAVTSTKFVAEFPKGSGLGTLLNNAVAGAQFTPAYDNGKPAPGTTDVVADFGQL